MYKLTVEEARLDGRYFRQLDLILDDLFQTAAVMKWSWSRLGTEAGLGKGTVNRLGNRETRRPSFAR